MKKHILLFLLLLIVVFMLVCYFLKDTPTPNIESQEYEMHIVEIPVLNNPNRINDKVSLGVYTITAYCPCVACSGGYGTQTAIGKKAEANRTVAGWLPFGTEIEINGQRYIVEDRTANWIRERYDGKVIDIYFDTHLEVQKFGKKKLEVFRIVG